MIDIAQHTTCKVCGKPIVQNDCSRGHRKRVYCADQYKQVAYRQRKEQPQSQSVMIVTIDEQYHQARIAE